MKIGKVSLSSIDFRSGFQYLWIHVTKLYVYVHPQLHPELRIQLFNITNKIFKNGHLKIFNEIIQYRNEYILFSLNVIYLFYGLMTYFYLMTWNFSLWNKLSEIGKHIGKLLALWIKKKKKQTKTNLSYFSFKMAVTIGAAHLTKRVIKLLVVIRVVITASSPHSHSHIHKDKFVSVVRRHLQLLNEI